MKEFEKMVVGKDSGESTLGYMFPWYEGARGLKAIESIKKWGSKDISIEKYDNTFINGFKIIGFDTRYRTDNKVINILDPRGFSLQIYMSSFFELLPYVTIVEGVIQENCKYLRSGAHNTLVAESCPAYKKVTDPTKIDKSQWIKENQINFNKMKAGDLFARATYDDDLQGIDLSTPCVYLGKFKISCKTGRATWKFDRSLSPKSNDLTGLVQTKEVSGEYHLFTQEYEPMCNLANNIVNEKSKRIIRIDACKGKTKKDHILLKAIGKEVNVVSDPVQAFKDVVCFGEDTAQLKSFYFNVNQDSYIRDLKISEV